MLSRSYRALNLQNSNTIIPLGFRYSSSLKKSNNNHPTDVVYETEVEKKVINEAVKHIQEEDLEHDELGMKQHKQHHHMPTWKEAENALKEEELKDEPRSLPEKPRICTHKAYRLKHHNPNRKRAVKEKVLTRIQTEGLNAQQRKMLKSNPSANIALSGKKQRKVMKQQKRVNKLLYGGEVDMVDMVEYREESHQTMELASQGTGTTLGGN